MTWFKTRTICPVLKEDINKSQEKLISDSLVREERINNIKKTIGENTDNIQRPVPFLKQLV